MMTVSLDILLLTVPTIPLTFCLAFKLKKI
jgi:hypothetical protein